MKTKAILALLLWWSMSIGALAAGQGVLIVGLTDGNTLRFMVPVQNPHVGCSFGVMKIDYLAEGNEARQLQFDRDAVTYLKMTAAEELNLETIEADESRISFDLTRSSVVHVSGLKDADRLQVYRIDGKRAKAIINRRGSEATVSIDGEQRGIYLVSVNHCFTFKLMKP